MLAFAGIYYVTPDVQHRSFRFVLPGAVVAVVLWLLASFRLLVYVSRVADVGALYGAFAGAIVLVALDVAVERRAGSSAPSSTPNRAPEELDAGSRINETLELRAAGG